MHPLLIIDLQKGFINQHTRHIPAKINELFDKYELIIATQFVNLPGSNFRKLLQWHDLSEGDASTEMAIDLHPHVVKIKKYGYSCINDDFMKLIREKGVDFIDICGLDTEGCVLKSAVDLFEIGITPRVLSDYCASSGGHDYHEAGIKVLKRLIGDKQVI